MSTTYSFNNIENKSMRRFAKELGTTSNKMLDYLREKDMLDYYNEPLPGYEDWFHKVDYGQGVKRQDLTPKGEQMISKMIESDGIKTVNKRKVNGANRKGK